MISVTRRITIITLLIAFFLTNCSVPPDRQQDKPGISSSDLKIYFEYFSQAKLQNRRAGSIGEAKAANYMADQMKQFGLEAAGDDLTYFQHFPIPYDVQMADSGNFLKTRHVQLSSDEHLAAPWGGSKSGTATGDLLFAGYGIRAPDLDYDDYDEINAEGKIVLLLRSGPDHDEKGNAPFRQYYPLAKKVAAAEQAGAKAVLVTSGLAQNKMDSLLVVHQVHGVKTSGIPVLQITPRTANILTRRNGLNLKKVQQQIDANQKPHSRDLDYTVTVSTNLVTQKRIARNVLGRIRGQKYPDHYLVVGTHYDNPGFGKKEANMVKDRSAVSPGKAGSISGIAGLLELAQYYATHPTNNSILFIAFSANDEGRLGSVHFLDHPTIPTDSIFTMISLGQIGRSMNHKMQVSGMKSAKSWKSLILRIQIDSLEVDTSSMSSEGEKSDYISFLYHHIPAINYSTGDYKYLDSTHTGNNLNDQGEIRILEHIRRLIAELDTLNKHELKFDKSGF